jgi:virginiamycin B lyase
METNKNMMFSMSRRKAIAGLLMTGVSLATGIVTSGSAFASTRSTLAQPTIKKLKATKKTSQLVLKRQTLRGTTAKAATKTYTLKGTQQATTFAATDLDATFTKFPVNSNPDLPGITTGDDGSSFWFAENKVNTGGAIGKITTQGAITEYALPLTGYAPRDIANGPNDGFWFPYTTMASSSQAKYIGKITSTGTLTLFTVPTNFTGIPSKITRGPNDTVWFSSYEGGVASISSTGTMTVYSLSGGIHIREVATGSDGALWMATSSGVVRFTTSGSYTLYAMSYAPEFITTGLNNDLWYAESDQKKLGRITTSGQLTEYMVTNLGASPSPNTIVHLGDGTYAFGTHPTTSQADAPNYMGRITANGDIDLITTPDAVSPVDLVYAGWANEVWFTTPGSIYKFRVNS